MIADAEPFALAGVVVTEILQGLKRDVSRLEHYLSQWDMLEPKGFSTYREAASIFRAARAKGVAFTTIDIKWQPWHDEKLAFTTGAFGLFYLRGSRDGDPAALWYGEASYKLTPTTRLTAGGYWASSGYAAPDPQAGAQMGFEQKINDHLNLIADWISAAVIEAWSFLTAAISAASLASDHSSPNGNPKRTSSRW
jgi:hypothetical protein